MERVGSVADASPRGAVIVAGASSGIGDDISTRLAEQGVPVIGISRRGTARHSDVRAVALDLTNDDAVNDILPGIVASAGPLRGIVHSIGDISERGTLTEIPWSQWMQTLDLCLGTAVRLARHTFDALAEARGSAVFISSVATTRPYANIAGYCAAKAALESFVRSLAGELSPYGARANAVCPAVVGTPFFDRSPYTEEQAAPMHRLGRIGRPRDVAGLAIWLLSPEAEWMTGSSIRLDGGMLL